MKVTIDENNKIIEIPQDITVKEIKKIVDKYNLSEDYKIKTKDSNDGFGNFPKDWTLDGITIPQDEDYQRFNYPKPYWVDPHSLPANEAAPKPCEKLEVDFTNIPSVKINNVLEDNEIALISNKDSVKLSY